MAMCAAACLAAPAWGAGAQSAAAQNPAPRSLRGVVFADSNHNGRPDAGEPGIAGVVVSDGRDAVASGPDGRYSLALAADAELAFVSLPDGWKPAGRFWLPLDGAAGETTADFALVRRPETGELTFLHASDTHLSEKSLPRMRLLRALVEKIRPDFVLLTGDLVRDALRVGEAEARGYYELVVAELAQFPVPVFTVPGNHELFGIERQSSLVSRENPLYGRKMYRHYLGPEYYSFDWGGIHFLGLDSVDNDDLWYYGHLDATQLAWVERDLAFVKPNTPLVTFNHIPFATSIDVLNGYTDEPPAPTLIRIAGHPQYRHVVSNFTELLAKLNGHRLDIALAGHMHVSESLALDTTAGRIRFHQTAAVVGPSDAGGMQGVSGVTLYRAKNGHVDDGTFLPLDPSPPPSGN